MARESLKDLGPARLSWSAILGGTAVAVGMMILLYGFGIAIGFTTADASARGTGIWFAIWVFLVPIISLFVGAMISGRFSGVTNRKGGAVHGAVTWGVSSLVNFMLVGAVLTTLLGGLARVGGAAASATGAAASGALQGGQAMGLDAQDLLVPINEARAERGQPPLRAEALQAALQDAASRAIREGRVDRELLVGALAENTQISRAEAEEIAGGVEERAGALGAQVGQAAETVLDVMAGLAWYSFAASLLSLIAAMAAGAISVSPTQKRPLTEPVRAPLATGPREAYP